MASARFSVLKIAFPVLVIDAFTKGAEDIPVHVCLGGNRDLAFCVGLGWYFRIARRGLG